MKMQLAFCWAVAYSSSSHWISIFTHDSAFVTRTPPSGAGVVLSMSPERHNRQCLSKPNGWEHFTQKAKEVFIILCGLIRFNPEVLRLAMCYTHITWELHTQNFYSDLVGKSADNEGSGFSLYSRREFQLTFIRKCSLCTRQMYPRLHKACYWMSFSMTLITFSKIPRARDINLSSSRAFSVD